MEDATRVVEEHNGIPRLIGALSVFDMSRSELQGLCQLVKIHKLPDGYCRHELIVKLLQSAGEVLETRINEPPGRVRQDWEGNRSGKKSHADLPSPKPAARRTEELGDGELKDTASSPHKSSQPIDMDLDKTSRKRLNMEEGVVIPQEEGLSIPTGGRLLITDGVDEILKGKSPVLDMGHQQVQRHAPKCKLVWPHPAEHEVALSVDGSFQAMDGSADSGMILRDSKGAVIFASYRKLFHCNDALEAELHAIKEGLQLATEHSQATLIL
ncbi:autophagy-related protein 7 [Hordeum vulgare]|nr:autophagy-related protein 7 [Hordeum vulgare]